MAFGDGIVQSDCSSKLGKGRKRAWLCSALQGWRQAAGAPFPNTRSAYVRHTGTQGQFSCKHEASCLFPQIIEKRLMFRTGYIIYYTASDWWKWDLNPDAFDSKA